MLSAAVEEGKTRRGERRPRLLSCVPSECVVLSARAHVSAKKDYAQVKITD